MNEEDESYMPYDFIVTEDGNRHFIEVKGTPSKEKSVFYMSQDEWQVRRPIAKPIPYSGFLK